MRYAFIHVLKSLFYSLVSSQEENRGFGKVNHRPTPVSSSLWLKAFCIPLHCPIGLWTSKCRAQTLKCKRPSLVQIVPVSHCQGHNGNAHISCTNSCVHKGLLVPVADVFLQTQMLIYEGQSLSGERREICDDVEDAGRDLFAHGATLHALRGWWSYLLSSDNTIKCLNKTHTAVSQHLSWLSLSLQWFVFMDEAVTVQWWCCTRNELIS